MSVTMNDKIDLEHLDSILPQLKPHSHVALLGGSFNPPHLGHSLLALSAISTLPISELWVLPCADHPFGKSLAPFQTRVSLCQATFQPLGDAVKVIEIEEKLPQPNYTVQTLRSIHRVRKGIQLYWVAGSDIHEDLHRWQEPEALPELARIVTVERQGHLQKGFLGFPLPEISSSMIRQKIRAGDCIAGWTEKVTAKRIQELGLYL
jgi:nicotinate-nucleotide adenylyltransferase